MTDTPEKTTALDLPKAAPPAKLTMGQAAAQQDPAVLDAEVLKRRDALHALQTDPTMPEDVRKAVETLHALASPNKPGLEEMVAAWKLPRINIAQPTTRSEAKPETARQGALYTTAGQLLEMPWGGIPLYIHEENINFPEQGKNPVCQAPDGKLGSPYGECLKCPHLPFGKQNAGRGDQKKTDCQSNIVAIMLAKDLSNVYMVQFGKTSRKAGSALMSLAGQQTVLWRQSYLLNTEKKTGDLGLYYIYKVEPTGKDNPEHVLKLSEALYGLYIAERRRFLAEWYLRPVRAPMVAVEAEGQFTGGALDAGLAGNEGVEPDLSTPTAEVLPAAAKTSGKGPSGARTSPKPM
jgi:hypothetical protein